MILPPIRKHPIVSGLSIVLLSLFCIVGLQTTHAHAEETFPYLGKIKNKNTKVYAGQNENFEVLGQLDKDETVVVVDKSFAWRKIRLPDKAKAYISTGYTRDLGDGVSEITGSRLNVRAGAGTNFSVIGRLGKGERVVILEKNKDWCLIDPPAKTFGWVLEQDVEFQPGEIPPEKDVEAPSRNIYKRKHIAEEQKKNSQVDAQGIVVNRSDNISSPDTRHILVVDGKPAYVLKGFRHVIDGFLSQKVQIEGQPQKESAAGLPVVLVTKITLVL